MEIASLQETEKINGWKWASTGVSSIVFLFFPRNGINVPVILLWLESLFYSCICLCLEKNKPLSVDLKRCSKIILIQKNKFKIRKRWNVCCRFFFFCDPSVKITPDMNIKATSVIQQPDWLVTTTRKTNTWNRAVTKKWKGRDSGDFL